MDTCCNAFDNCIESSFHPCKFTAIVQGAYPGEAKMCLRLLDLGNDVPAWLSWGSLKARSDRARRRASTRVDARRCASTNLHKLNERCQFKLYIGYWTSKSNKWPKCSCHGARHQQTTPGLMTSLTMQWRNWKWHNWQLDTYIHYLMHTSLASRPCRRASTRAVWTGLWADCRNWRTFRWR